MTSSTNYGNALLVNRKLKSLTSEEESRIIQILAVGLNRVRKRGSKSLKRNRNLRGNLPIAKTKEVEWLLEIKKI